MDQAGFLYGMTVNGGVPPYSSGTVFMVEPSGNETVLHSFGQNPGEQDGSSPRGGLIMDQAGNLYGTTCCGGYGLGTVFKLDPSGMERFGAEFDLVRPAEQGRGIERKFEERVRALVRTRHPQSVTNRYSAWFPSFFLVLSLFFQDSRGHCDAN
jgi:uncharacterized repeat protein (TIGR03803 family)